MSPVLSVIARASANHTVPIPSPSHLDINVLEALSQNNIAQWLMLALAIPASLYAINKIVSRGLRALERPGQEQILAVDTEGAAVHVEDIQLVSPAANPALPQPNEPVVGPAVDPVITTSAGLENPAITQQGQGHDGASLNEAIATVSSA